MRHQGTVDALTFSPDGKVVATGSADKTERFWNAADGSALGRPVTLSAAVTYVTFSPDSRTILTRSDDGIARFWHAPTAVYP
jgi:WD40 repeat protein